MHSISDFPRHCGSKIFHGFWLGSKGKYKTYFPKSDSNTAFAVFIDRSDQQKAYEALKKRFKILYQSPVLKPKSKDQNPYFIVIYLNEKP